jgi:hypothetical protein
MSLKLTMARRFAPRYRPAAALADAQERRQALWPTFSIGFLLCISVILGPLVLTVLNTMLVALALILALVTNRPMDRVLLHLIVPFVGILFIGLATGLDADRYDYFKDAWYIANPLIVMLAGYVLYLAKPDLARGLRAFVIGGLIVALWQLRGYVMHPEILLESAGTIRRIIGTGLYAPVLALTIMIVYAGRWKFSLRLPPGVAWVLFIVISASVLGVFSRTAVMVLGIAVLAWLGLFARQEWLRLGVPLVVLVSLGIATQVLHDAQSDRALQTFSGKMARTIQELTVSDYSGVREINLNFRGYETKRAMLQFEHASVPEMFVGRGFGATVDLGLFLPLQLNDVGSRSVRYITLLHNGYMYLLTKVGIVGLLLYAWVLAYLYMLGRKAAVRPMADEQARAGRLLQASVVTLAATTYIVGGVFNKFDMFQFMLLTGYLVAYLRESPSAGPRAATARTPNTVSKETIS